MATDRLCSTTLGDIGNGSAREHIDEQIDRAVADTAARGQDGKKRIVTIQLELELDEEEIIARVHVLFKPPPFFAGASRGEVSQQRGEVPAMLFDLAESEDGVPA